jgi:hypothetical protein
MAQVMTKVWYLRNIDIFRGLSDEEVRMIDGHSFMQQIRRGQAIYLQGSPARYVYILKKGVVKINRLTSQGKEIFWGSPGFVDTPKGKGIIPWEVCHGGRTKEVHEGIQG